MPAARIFDSFALYRLPLTLQCRFVAQSGVPSCAGSFAGIGRERGFVVAPFKIAPSTPLLLIKPEIEQNWPSQDQVSPELKPMIDMVSASNAATFGCGDDDAERDYAGRFNCYERALSEGLVRKVVCSRVKSIDLHPSPFDMFVEAARLYPRMYVALFSTPKCGTWLVATPELLVSQQGMQLKTMALAGTMDLSQVESLEHLVWDEKNKAEQRIVAEYLQHRLASVSESIETKGPYTVQAGHLAHLRTDFGFALSQGKSLGDLVDCLHPTPAVCGDPKDNALDLILRHEGSERKYYSGFSGPVGLDGNTALYVTLRCMMLGVGHCLLHAGGGLLCDSVERKEWQETEDKMKTMLKVIENVQ